MSVLGLIVEYNPFHNGHLYHIQQAKKITTPNTTVAVMSGSFVQRGEPALINKWKRTEMALQNGIDLVVELPTVYATQSADLFAFGSTFLLNKLGIDTFVFGSEENSIEKLDKISELLLNEPIVFKKILKDYLSQGYAYPKALAEAINIYFDDKDYNISKPNDILGLQYIYQLKKQNSAIKPCTIARQSAGHHDKSITSDFIASATAIRNNLLQHNDITEIKKVIPASNYKILLNEFQQNRINSWDNYIKSLKLLICSHSSNELHAIHGIDEGIENRLKQNILSTETFNQFVELIKTKRYTKPKIQRLLLNILLNITKEKIANLDIMNGPQYIRILGFNEKGRTHLNKVKHDIDIPIITNIRKIKSPMLEIDISSSIIYEEGLNTTSKVNEYITHAIYKKNYFSGKF